MPKRKLSHLINLGSYSKYKGIPSFKKSKQKNKENVSFITEWKGLSWQHLPCSQEPPQRDTVIFLPKFHCELNFIEQCWGYAKRIYRHYPASSKEADLKQNLLASLEAVPLESMRKSVCSVDTILHILTCYIDLHLALADSWRHMRQVLMENWLCGLRRLTKDIACLRQMTYWLIIIRSTHRHNISSIYLQYLMY